MGNRRYKKILIFTGVCAFCGILSGCSLSFCGLSTGDREELVFTCDENTVSEPDEAALGIRKAESAMTDEVEIQKTPKDDRINLNTAEKEELMTLNGIGESRAEAILAYRKEKGAFTSIEDIMQVSGIKEGIFSKIKDQITVR